MKLQQKPQALKLRKEGYSLKEVAGRIGISKSTSSLWLRNVRLSPQAQARLASHCREGILRGAAVRHKLGILTEDKIRHQVKQELERLALSRAQQKIMCAMLYWAEGSKDKNVVGFTNSDPVMMKTFITLLREAFAVDESKFRMLLHLHEYHNAEKQKQFWSQVTGIPLKQFNKSYVKPHTGKNTRDGYPGCAALRYYDHKVALELKSVYQFIGQNLGA
jgi:transcriptional regulator with XRE-family HTH domain